MPYRHSVLCVAVAVALGGCTTMEAQIRSSGSMGQTDAEYITTAEQLVALDDQAGKMAATKAADPRVVDVSSQIMASADTLSPGLQAAIKVAGMQPPKLPADTAAEVQKLATLHGPAFDKEYVADELALHQKAVAVFQQEDAKTQDGALRTQVEAELPALQDDLAKLQVLSGNPPSGNPS